MRSATTSPQPPWPRSGRILVRVPNWVGDAVLAEPALRALRAACPDAVLHALAVPWVEGVLALMPALDGVVRFDRRGAHRGPLGMEALARELRSGGYDAALTFPRSWSSAWVLRRARIPVRVGVAGQGRSPLLTHAIDAGPLAAAGRHDVERHLALAAALGGRPGDDRDPVLAVNAARRGRAREILDGCGLGRSPYVAVAPGAAFGGAKRWTAAGFARAAQSLWEGAGDGGEALETVLLGSPGERPIALEVARRMDRTPVDLVGRIDLDESLAVLAGARLLLTNDSGLMHAGAALGVPLVAIFGPTDALATGPRGPRARVVSEPVSCAPCFLRECPLDHRCMERVTPERVTAAARVALATA